MARASIESIATVEEDSDDAEESATHYLPNGIYSLESLRFPGLFLGELQMFETETLWALGFSLRTCNRCHL